MLFTKLTTSLAPYTVGLKIVAAITAVVGIMGVGAYLRGLYDAAELNAATAKLEKTKGELQVCTETNNRMLDEASKLASRLEESAAEASAKLVSRSTSRKASSKRIIEEFIASQSPGATETGPVVSEGARQRINQLMELQ